MNIGLRIVRSLSKPLLAVLWAALLVHSSSAEPLTLRRAVELAVTHSNATGVAAADQMQAYELYREAKNTYLPQFILGSGVGGSYGFPLSLEGSAPSLFSVNSQQTVFSPAQKEFVRAARADWQASSTQTQNQREAVALDVALSYAELDNWESRSEVLRSQETQAQKMVQAEDLRVREGVDSPVELTKARLTEARVRMRMAGAQGSADVLRKHLAQLTGLPAQSIETVTESIPSFPQVQADDQLPDKEAENSPAVKVADLRAVARELRAKGERRALFPAVDLAGQYALLSSTLNHYDQFFSRRFQPHNATIGLIFRFPFLDPVQRAKAQQATAEAIHARKEANQARDQVATETLKLQRAVQQLAAARDVAQLEYQLAQSDLEAVEIRIQSGTATLKEQQDARNQASERYQALLDSSFELDKAQMQLLRTSGGLEKWATSGR